MPIIPANESLRSSITRGREFESISDRLRARHVANVGDITQEQGRLGRGAASAVQQKFRTPGGGSFSRQLEQTLRRGKARQGIMNRGDAAIRNQQLKDRLALARSSVGRRGALQQTSADAARLRAGLSATERAAKSQVGSAFAGAGGFILGGAARGFKDFFGSPEIPVATDVGQFRANDPFNDPLAIPALDQIGGRPLVGPS